MSSFRGYSILCQILVIAYAVVHANGVVSTVSKISDDVSKMCQYVEDLPENLCNAVADKVEKKIDNACDAAARGICEHIPYPFSLLTAESTCEGYIEGTICHLTDDLLGVAKEECIKEMENLLLGAKCSSAGKSMSDICEHLPNTASGFCDVIVDKACDKLPPFLRIFESLCQDLLSKICDDIL